MARSRRDFLKQGSLTVAGAALACGKKPQPQTHPQPEQPQSAAAPGTPSTPGAPPAFATAPPVGPVVNSGTFAEAEKLVQVSLSPAERNEAAQSWRQAMAPLYERRVGPRKVALEPGLAPWSRVEAAQFGKAGPERDRFIRSRSEVTPLPANEEDIAFAPVTQLSE